MGDKAKGADGDDDEFSHGDDADDEVEYTPQEVSTVQASVLAMEITLECVKLSLGALTTVSDKIHSGAELPPQAASQELTAVAAAAAAQTSSKSDQGRRNNDDDDNCAVHAPCGEMGGDAKQVCAGWVADLASQASQLNSAVVDLGAELYPPFAEEIEPVRVAARQLQKRLAEFMYTLTGEYANGWGEDGGSTQSVGRALRAFWDPNQLASVEKLTFPERYC